VDVTLGEDPEDDGTAYLGVVIRGFIGFRSEGERFPPRMGMPNKSFRFRLPLGKEPFGLDRIDDALRRFRFRFGPWNPDGQISSFPGDSA
jgi:hypothetical protein